MAVLVWEHGKSYTEALAAIQATLADSGYAAAVTWDGGKAEVRYGPFASVLHAKGEVTEEVVVLEKCSGLVGGLVLKRCQEMLGRLFPAASRPSRIAWWS